MRILEHLINCVNVGWRIHCRVSARKNDGSWLEEVLMLVFNSSIPTVGFNMKRVQKGHVTLKWYGFRILCLVLSTISMLTYVVGILVDSLDFVPCGSDTVVASMLLCEFLCISVCGVVDSD